MTNQLSFSSLNYVKVTKGHFLNSASGNITCFDCRDRPRQEVRAMAHVLYHHIQTTENRIRIYSSEEETVEKLVEEACRNYWKGELHWDVLLRKGAQNPDAAIMMKPRDDLRQIVMQKGLPYSRKMTRNDLADTLIAAAQTKKRIRSGQYNLLISDHF